jgi:hypothetical protein
MVRTWPFVRAVPQLATTSFTPAEFATAPSFDDLLQATTESQTATTMLIAAALIEGVGLFGLVVSILLATKAG